MFMRDIVFPRGNEQEFIDTALRLGISELVFVYSKQSDFFKGKSNVKVVNAVFCDYKNVRRFKQSGILTVCKASREAIECSADIVFDAEEQDVRDKTHYRMSGLNHVLCKLACQNNVGVGFSFSSVLKSYGQARSVLMGRMMQNILLCSKYKTPVVFASFADSPWLMRSPVDVNSFFAGLGASQKIVKKVL